MLHVACLLCPPWQGTQGTGDEWHAQSKLSLIVSGVFARVPTCTGTHVDAYLLLVSEVVDHDAQAANIVGERGPCSSSALS